MLKCCTCFGSSRWSETQLHSYVMFGRNCVGRLAGWLFLHTYVYEWKNGDGCKYYGDLKVAGRGLSISSIYHPHRWLFKNDTPLRFVLFFRFVSFFVSCDIRMNRWPDRQTQSDVWTDIWMGLSYDYYDTPLSYFWAAFVAFTSFFISICTWHSHCGAS